MMNGLTPPGHRRSCLPPVRRSLAMQTTLKITKKTPANMVH